MFFGWLRRAARDSVLAGVQDALEEIAPEADQAPPRLDRLRGLAAAEAKQLAAAKGDEDEPKKGRGR